MKAPAPSWFCSFVEELLDQDVFSRGVGAPYWAGLRFCRLGQEVRRLAGSHDGMETTTTRPAACRLLQAPG